PKVSNENPALEHRPIIIGAGPAGLFAAYFLAKAGFSPIVLERGSAIEDRSKEVKAFWAGGELLEESNVQFGEGGAGAFSDGKLNTGNKDRDGSAKTVLEVFTAHGAPEEILYDAAPHIGTDNLYAVVQNLRQDILEHGGEIRYHVKVSKLRKILKGSLREKLSDGDGVMLTQKPSQLLELQGNFSDNKNIMSTKEMSQSLELRDDVSDYADIMSTEKPSQGKNDLWEITMADGEVLYADAVLLAVGHSSRDTFKMLSEQGFALEKKAFAIGLRCEHPQQLVNGIQYGTDYPKDMPPASYKLTGRTKTGRAVYSFCMCPGGYVVNASSEKGCLAINGMSYGKRDGKNANSAIVLAVSPEDIFGDDPLKAVEWQRELERKAYALGEGRIPYCSLQEFRERKLAEEEQDAKPSPAHKGDSVKAPVWELFDKEAYEGLLEAFEQFGKKMKGFDDPDVILSGIESRTSSPLRILRDAETMEAVGNPGVYPVGEGAGYSGGILSSAVDGIKAAARIVSVYRPCEKESRSFK
ncbi:MAG: NAD(P)-binding protein, partial [Lachnospiraceae bacterium]|nr:NAD(P)-binding protein [Lachnospiraceae bacterium]